MLVIKARAALRLGLTSLYRVLSYRLGVKLGFNSVRRITANIDNSQAFFSPPATLLITDLPLNRRWLQQHCYFGWHKIESDNPPSWHLNCFNGVKVSSADKPWWVIPDFDPKLGDIKTVWEASRFDWVSVSLNLR